MYSKTLSIGTVGEYLKNNPVNQGFNSPHVHVVTSFNKAFYDSYLGLVLTFVKVASLTREEMK